MESPDRNAPNNDDDATEKADFQVTEPSGFRVWLWKQARKIVVFVLGSTVLLIGIAMIVFPGPAVLVIPLGLAILATEFVWARDWLEYAKRHLHYLSSQVQSRTKKEPTDSSA
ncbi:PGPGW domain-containing protein [Schlesneria sp. T3-172]|uniref:PGPGW domain-containing protein n=1 Tax=Schlesneria TaxID=656899 RepID=UPI002F2276C7